MKINYSEQRAKYKGMSREEIVQSMTMPELMRNAKRGGVDAIAELERREARKERVLRDIIPQPELDIGV